MVGQWEKVRHSGEVHVALGARTRIVPERRRLERKGKGLRLVSLEAGVRDGLAERAGCDAEGEDGDGDDGREAGHFLFGKDGCSKKTLE
jgi:hypothetical protein